MNVNLLAMESILYIRVLIVIHKKANNLFFDCNRSNKVIWPYLTNCNWGEFVVIFKNKLPLIHGLEVLWVCFQVFKIHLLINIIGLMKWVGGLFLTYFVLCSSVPPPDLDSWALRADRCDKLSVPVCFFFQLFGVHLFTLNLSWYHNIQEKGGFGSWCGCSSEVDKELDLLCRLELLWLESTLACPTHISLC
jgi:hypothetical protein